MPNKTLREFYYEDNFNNTFALHHGEAIAKVVKVYDKCKRWAYKYSLNVQKHICRDKIENSCIGYSGYKNLKICSDSLRNAVATLFIKRPNTSAKTGGQTTIEQVYSLIKNSPTITRAQLMELTGKSSNTIQKCILKLKQDNRIKRIGSPTFGGYWQIIE